MATECKEIDMKTAREELYNYIMSPGIIGIPHKIFKSLLECYKKLTDADFEPIPQTTEYTCKVGDQLPIGNAWSIVNASPEEVVLRQVRYETQSELYKRLVDKLWRYATHNYLNTDQ